MAFSIIGLDARLSIFQQRPLNRLNALMIRTEQCVKTQTKYRETINLLEHSYNILAFNTRILYKLTRKPAMLIEYYLWTPSKL